MIKRIFCIILALFALTLCGCNEGGGADEGQGDEKLSYTLMIYMCGSTLESKNGNASKNLAELLSADIPEGVNIVIQTGGAKRWYTDGISASSTDRYAVSDGELVMRERISRLLNFGAAQTLADFAAWATQSYPAEQYGLILWNHGGGSVRGVCFDENFSNDSLTLDELDTALSSATQSTGQKFEFIGFDACLMANIEVAFTVEKYSLNMIASQELEPASGWDYQAIAENLGKADFYEKTLHAYAQKSADKTYYTLSHIDFSGFSALAQGLGELVRKLSADEQPRTVVSALNSGEVYGSYTARESVYNLYDLGNLFSAYGIDGALDCVTGVSGELRQGASGLSIYFPLKSDSELSKYFNLSPLKDYVQYLKDFYAREQEENIFINAPLSSNGAGKYSFGVTHNSLGNIQSVIYSIRYGKDGKVYELGSDAADCSYDTTVSFSLDLEWMTFGGMIIYCELVAYSGDLRFYQMPIEYGEERFWATIWFAYDVSTSNTTVMGFTYDVFGGTDQYDSLMLYDLPYGAEIYPMVREVSASGKVSDYFADQPILYQGDDMFKVQALPAADEYEIFATVYDIYNNAYEVGSVSVSK